MKDKEVWKKRIPNLTVGILTLISSYLMVRSILLPLSIVVTQYKDKPIHYVSFLFGNGESLSIIWLAISGIITVFTWLLSTRVKAYQSKPVRLAMFALPTMTIAASLVGFGMTLVKREILPFFNERLANVIDTDKFVQFILFDQVKGFYLMLLLLPLIVLVFILMFVSTKYLQHEDELNNAFFQFQWRGEWLRKFSDLEGKEFYPDIELGINVKTKEMVIIPGNDRPLNTSIIGPIGTGKSAALGKPILNQDLHGMTRFINDYPTISKLKNYVSTSVLGRYLNGISVIEPSNELCQDIYQLCKAHHIPDEVITYIDPTNPDTPSINPMKGPVDKVAEVFAQVIAGLSDKGDGGNFYFEQAQRIHLKQHIYLLKMHDETKDVTFDMLLEMYENTSMVHEMHMQLKKRIPSNFKEIQNRDERNYWSILKGIDAWFDNNLVPLQERGQGGMTVIARNEEGEIIYEDKQAKDVNGLRNILNDIGSNPLIRRVLFGTSDFDFDTHMEKGGVLLVNTAKGELEALNSVLGKIVIMSLQNATFRRKPKVSAFHNVFIDEIPEYLYSSFRSFPAQSRKYKVIIHALFQTIAQLADQFGEYYMTTIIATMRNRMVYGDLPAFDAEYFAKQFGEHYTYQEGESEQSVSPLQENPISRSGSSYSKVREQNLSESEIMYQDAFECAVKIVVNNKPIPVQQIKANFVPDEEFETAVVTVNEEAASIWLKERKESTMDQGHYEIESIEETEKKNQEFYEAEKSKPNTLNPETVEKAISIENEPRPITTTVNYGDTTEKNDNIKNPLLVKTGKTLVTESVDVIDLAPTLGEKTIVNEKSVNNTAERDHNGTKESASVSTEGQTKAASAPFKAELLFKKKPNDKVKDSVRDENVKTNLPQQNPLLEKKNQNKGPTDESSNSHEYVESQLEDENIDFLHEIEKDIQ